MQQRLVDAVQVSGDMMTVIDFEEYKRRKKDEESQRAMKALIQKLDSMADYAYEHYDRTELKGYENFKKLLKTLDKKHGKDKE
jgi:two-component sensor histidine kinase